MFLRYYFSFFGLFFLSCLPLKAADAFIFGFDSAPPPLGWFQDVWEDEDLSLLIWHTSVVDPLAIPGMDRSNLSLRITHQGKLKSGRVSNYWVPQDWRGYEALGFWVYGSDKLDAIELEIFDGPPNPNLSDSERFRVAVNQPSPSWVWMEIPFSDFSRIENRLESSGGGLQLDSIWGWSFRLISKPESISEQLRVYMDELTLIDEPFETFEALDGFFSLFKNDASGISFSSTPLVSSAQPPGKGLENQVLSMSVNVNGYVGVLRHFKGSVDGKWTPMDWSYADGVELWVYGKNSGATFFFDLLDNRNLVSEEDNAERFTFEFEDNFNGWKKVSMPFSGFFRKSINNGGPDDGLNLTEVNGWAFGITGTGAQGSYYIDDIDLYPEPAPPVQVERWYGPGVLYTTGTFSYWLEELTDFGIEWIYIWKKGWAFGYAENDAKHLYLPGIGWCWTTPSVYPILYHYQSGEWFRH